MNLIFPQTAMLQPKLSQQHCKPQLRVLIVDDTAQIRQDLAVLLELSGGVEVVGQASGGLEGVHLAEKLHPDVVVMDLELHGMDGCQAAGLMKMQDLVRRVVFLSIYARPEDVQRARQAGADAYIQKGAPLEDLLDAVLTDRRIFPDQLEEE
jgi:two-component system nitrate/nitrite response regulator NarL